MTGIESNSHFKIIESRMLNVTLCLSLSLSLSLSIYIYIKYTKFTYIIILDSSGNYYESQLRIEESLSTTGQRSL